MTTEKLTWYAARAGGIVAWLLLVLALVWGLLLAARVLGKRSSPAWLLAVHRHLGALCLLFTAVHVAAIMADDFVDFGLNDVLVPMASEWKAGPVAWGVVAMYLVIAIEATSLAMRWLPKRLWRAVHLSSIALFITATIHGWTAGTDNGQTFMIAIALAVALLVVLVAIRVGMARQGASSEDQARERRRRLAEIREQAQASA